MKKPAFIHLGDWLPLASLLALAGAACTAQTHDLRILNAHGATAVNAWHFDFHQTNVPVGIMSSHHVQAGDMDGNGEPDLVFSIYSDDTVAILFQENGVWSAPFPVDSSFPSADGIHLADMDRDGDLDIVAVSGSSHRCIWWENLTGDGLSWTERP